MDCNLQWILKDFISIGAGIPITLSLMCCSLVIGFPLGVFMAVLLHRGGLLSFWIRRFVSIIRGTPLILQLSFVYFSISRILGIKMDIMSAGIFTFGVNSGAYITEIIRSGIESVPKGQFEACKVLEITSFSMWKDIILPQVIRKVTPSLINEGISLLKETALISTIGGSDIMRKSQHVGAENFDYFGPLCIAGLYYYILVLIIEYIGYKIEQKLKNVDS